MLKPKSLIPSQLVGFGLAAPIAAFSLLGLANSAAAVSFTPGSTLAISASFTPIGGSAMTTLNFDFLTNTGNPGAGGNFGVIFASTGDFVPYINAGGTTTPGGVIPDYKIFDSNFANIGTVASPLLQVNPNPNGSALAGWQLSLTSLSIISDTPISSNIRQINFHATGLFQNGQPQPADVAFQGQIFINAQSGTFQLQATAVPEPLTMLGVGTAAGFGAFFKRRLAKKQNNA